MWINIIADASFCNDTKCGGYAFFVSSERGKFGDKGQFTVPLVSNVHAEMAALANGVYAACNKKKVLDGDSILIQSDCIAALEALSGDRDNLNEHETKVRDSLLSIKEYYRLSFRFKHIKGHSNKDGAEIPDARSLANVICDKKARKEMNRARNSFLAKQVIEGVGL